MEEGRSALKLLTGTSAGKRLLGWPRRRWEDDIRIDLNEIGDNMKNWVVSAQKPGGSMPHLQGLCSKPYPEPN